MSELRRLSQKGVRWKGVLAAPLQRCGPGGHFLSVSGFASDAALTANVAAITATIATGIAYTRIGTSNLQDIKEEHEQDCGERQPGQNPLDCPLDGSFL